MPDAEDYPIPTGRTRIRRWFFIGPKRLMIEETHRVFRPVAGGWTPANWSLVLRWRWATRSERVGLRTTRSEREQENHKWFHERLAAFAQTIPMPPVKPIYVKEQSPMSDASVTTPVDYKFDTAESCVALINKTIDAMTNETAIHILEDHKTIILKIMAGYKGLMIPSHVLRKIKLMVGIIDLYEHDPKTLAIMSIAFMKAIQTDLPPKTT